MIKKFNEYIKEANAKAIEAGELELAKLDYDDAVQYLKDQNIDIDNLVPNFHSNYNLAKQKFSTAKTSRHQMPSLKKEDMLLLQTKLKKGELDIKSPYSPTTDPKNPFPEGLYGKEAEDFLTRGLKDGNLTDDIINSKIIDIQVQNLIPIQKQIYFDQLATFFTNYNSVEKIISLIQKKYFLVSEDNYIIDGHHRYAILLLIKPELEVPTIKVELPIKRLLELSLAFGDALGNERNK